MDTLLQSLTEGGDVLRLLLVAVLAVGGLVLERALLRARWRGYYLLGFPLGVDLVPIPLPPKGRGETASVRWAVDEEGGHVRFWAEPGRRTAPMGLHGVVQLVRHNRGVHLPVRWAPPWTPVAALLWFAGLGLTQGQGHLTIPVGLLLVVVLFLLYRQAAVRAARELRWAFVRGDADRPEGEDVG